MRMRAMHGPRGDFMIPAEPDWRSEEGERGVRSVFDGEYSYPRRTLEYVHTALDVGCNLGSWSVWASCIWWPGQLIHIDAYDPNATALEYAQINCLGLPVKYHCKAVTSATDPVYFREQEHWGSSRTFGETSGVIVPSIDPEDLTNYDVVKIDNEGCEVEFFESYKHWATVRVCMFEYHATLHREPCQRVLRHHGFRMVRGNPLGPECDTQVWVKE